MGNFAVDIKKKILNIDWILVILALAATAYGLLLIKSATNFTNSLTQIKVQSAAIFLGLASAFFMSSIDYDHALKYVKVFYIISIFLLVFTLIFGTGDELNSRSWIRIPGTDIGGQPSEIVKILFIITFAKHLDSIKERINKPLNLLFLFLHAGIIIGLVLLQGDLGTGLVFMFIFVVMCFVAGMSLWYFFGGVFLLTVLSPIIWSFLEDYQKKRILVGFDPYLDPSNKGYQAIQSRIAIGSGGVFGFGYQKGPLTQHINPSNIVPKQHTDFIFSVSGEELGIFGTLLVIILLAFILLRIYHVSRKARNDVGSLMCMGVFAMFVFHSVENIGMCLGKLPVIGIPLPFFSYGGSSILSSYLGIGLVLSVYSRRNLYYFNQNEEIL